jgi:hypothetical protein
LKNFDLPKFLLLSIIFIIFFLAIGINSVYAQDDWHFVDESAARLPDTTTLSMAMDGGRIGSIDGISILVGQEPNIIRNLPGVAQLFLNNGQGFFDLADSSIFPQRNDETSVVMLFDIEGDGDLDAFIVNYDYITDFIAVNDGTGIFHIDWARLPRDTAVALTGDYADIEGDGDIDVCLLGNNEMRFSHRMWINGSQGYFHDEINRLPAIYDYYRYVGFADINGDLAPDIVAVYYDGYESHPTIFINDGTGHFTDETSSRLPQTQDLCIRAAPVDIDGDFDFDILLAFSTRLGFLINDGTGYFTDETEQRGPLYPPGGAPNNINSIDADNDGDEDLVLGSASTYPNLLFINNGSGYFTDETDIRWPNQDDGTDKVFAGDLNGDGVGDIFRVGRPSSVSRLYINSLTHPDSIPAHVKNQTIFPSIDTSRGPYPVKLMAKDGISIPYQLSVHVNYSTDGITFQADSMHYTGAYIYYGTIPEIDSGETVYYYYAATDAWHNTSNIPVNAPDSVFSFTYLPGYVGIEEDGEQLPEEISISAYPNPFNSDLSITLKGLDGSWFSLTIYDISGRVVKKLKARNGKGVGTEKTIWDGKTESGNAAPSGLYFLEVKTLKQRKSMNVVLLK